MMHKRTIKLIIESKIDDIDLSSKAVRVICNTVVSEEVLLYNLELCFVEAITNVIKHAYHRKPGNLIEIILTLDEEEVMFQIVDSGDKPNLSIPKELNHDLNDLASLPESGMGLFLIHQIMDEISFTEREGKNVLTMIKKLNPLRPNTIHN